MQQPDRLYKLNQIAISQMRILTNDSETKLLNKKWKTKNIIDIMYKKVV